MAKNGPRLGLSPPGSGWAAEFFRVDGRWRSWYLRSTFNNRARVRVFVIFQLSPLRCRCVAGLALLSLVLQMDLGSSCTEVREEQVRMGLGSGGNFEK